MDASDLSHLLALDALLQEASVSRAARRLGLSTAAMSHALARLRDRLGDPLLVRAGQGMVLTERAVHLKPKVHSVVTQADQLFTTGETFSPETLDREYVISVTDYVSIVLGPVFDAMARQQAPRLRLRLIPTTVEDAEELRQGHSDLAIGVYGQLPPELMQRKLLTDRLVCVLRKGHPLADKRMTLKRYVDLAHVQVAPRGQPGGSVDDLLRDRGLERRVVRAVPSFQVAARLVADSDYVLTVSRRVASTLAESLDITLVEPPFKFDPYAVNLVWHPRVDADAAHRWLRGLWLAAAGAVP